MIYLTGDTHGEFTRLTQNRLLRKGALTREDYVIICGDFGGIWYAGERQEKTLDALSRLPFTLLFADGNHENYDLLESYPISLWHGGKVQEIRENALHLMRGQIYSIEGKTFFVMGGAACHDLWNGVLDPGSPDFEEKYRRFRKRGAFFRIKGMSWWPQELPSEAEIAEGRDNLLARDRKVDIVISHCAPTEIQRRIAARLDDHSYSENRLTAFLQWVWDECTFQNWYCGHYHHEMDFGKLRVLYDTVSAI